MKKIIFSVQNFFTSLTGKLFLITFFIHAIIAVLINYGLIHIPYSAVDQNSYFDFASKIADMLRHGTYHINDVYGNHWYPLFLGLLFMIFGTSMIVGSLANVVLVSISAVLFLKILRLQNISERLAFWSSFIVMNGYASLMYHTSILLKDAWIVTLLLLMLYLSLKIIHSQKFEWKKFLALLVVFVSLRNLRFFVSYAAMVGFFVSWFFTSVLPVRRRLTLGAGMLAIVSLVTLALTGYGIGKEPSVAKYAELQTIYNIRQTYFATGDTTIHTGVILPSIGVHGGYTFSYRGFADASCDVLFGPFPWQLSLHRYLFAALDLAWWYPVFFLAVVGVYKTRFKDSILFLSTAILIAGIVIIGTDNLGAIMRYRICVFVLMSLFAPAGLSAVYHYYRDKKRHG